MSDEVPEAAAPAHANVHAALLGAMEEVGYVRKAGRVKGGRVEYNFAGEADLIHALRPAMLRHGLTFYVAAVDDVAFDSYQTSGNSTMRTTTARYTGRFTHAPSGTFFDAVAVGEGADSGDKSAPKAATIGLKYLLRQTFVIETGDDPDKDASVERAAPSSRQGPSPAPDRSGSPPPGPSVRPGASPAPGSGNAGGAPPCDLCAGPGKPNPAHERNDKAPPFRCAGDCVDDAVDKRGEHYPHGYSQATATQMKAVCATWTVLVGKMATQFGTEAVEAEARLRKWCVSWGMPESRKEWMRGHAGRFLDASKTGWMEERLLGVMETVVPASREAEAEVGREPGADEDVPC